MKYDFTTVVDRSKCGSAKWDGAENASVDCVPLSVADMEFKTAPPIAEAVKKVADEYILGYTHETQEYYEAVCSWMRRRHNFEVEKDWILTMPGVVDALAVLVDANTKPGDAVVILTPVYYPFDLAVFAKSRRIVYSTLIDNGGHYEIDYADLERLAKREDVTALLFCSPHNPVGRVWTREELKRVIDICCDNNVFIIDDEIHNDLIMPGYEHTVMATVSDRVLQNIAVCTAPSKSFNIAGLQCSNIIVPNPVRRVKTLACSLLNMQMQLNVVAYSACIAAYTQCDDWLSEAIEVIHENAEYVKDFLAEYFPEIKVIPLEGTYLLWLDMRGTGLTHTEMKSLLLDAEIYLDNGEQFGIAGRGYQRINLACPRSVIVGAMNRFKKAMDELRSHRAQHGTPYHKTLKKGDRLEGFIYDSPCGRGRDLSKTIKRKTLIVFARYFECEICQELLKTLKKSCRMLRLIGFDIKVVMQSDIETLEKAQADYPFELISDIEAKLYDRYNVFEAAGMFSMLAGDKMVEKMVGTDVKKLLESDMVLSAAASFAGAGEESAEPPAHREMQLSAFVAVDTNMEVIYAHYCKTMGDFPDTKELLKGLRGNGSKN